MKTLLALCVLGLGLAACDEHTKSNKSRDDAVDRTQTTSALIVDPTLHDSHAAMVEGVPEVIELDDLRDGG